MHIKDRQRTQRAVKTVQFGGGVFLRGFFDWMLQKANDAGVDCGNAVIIRARTTGADPLEKQNFMYTHVARDGEHTDVTVIDSIGGSINPAESYGDFLALARLPELNAVVSNTTEAGIVYECCEYPNESAPASFPARLCALLYERWRAGLGGLLVLPCELIENNGSVLLGIVRKHAEDWALPEAFLSWLSSECSFRNTLVDRIVSGKTDEKIPLEWEDGEVNTSEYFHLFVIEGEEDARLPFARLGMNVKWVKDVNEYRTLKVRILNGAHTSMIPYALLCGVETVGECMRNETVRRHLEACLSEIIASLGKTKRDEAEAYAASVVTRFENPFICHRCEAISLNSVSKFKVRVLPSILEFYERFGRYPEALVFSFAMLIKFYKQGAPKDGSEVIALMKRASVAELLSNEELWGADVSVLAPLVEKAMNAE